MIAKNVDLNSIEVKDKRTKDYFRKPGNIRKFAKIYNSLCKKCKHKLTRNPANTSYDDYCDKCQEKAKKILKGDIK